MARKKLCLVFQVTPSSSQICKEVQKPYCGRDVYLFWMSAQYFFQLLKINKYCLGAELAPAQQVMKKLMWITCGSTRCIPLHATTGTECDKKTKRVRQYSEYMFSIVK